MPPEPCPICTMDYTQKMRKRVVCEHCQEACCFQCFQTFLLDEERQSTATCMHCNASLTDEFITAQTSTAFGNRFRQVKTNKEMSKEMSLLPATQGLAAQERKARKLQGEIQDILELEQRVKHKVSELKLRRRGMKNKGSPRSEIEKVLDLERKLGTKLGELTRKRWDMNNRLYVLRSKPKKELDKKAFIQRCPVHECKGFVSQAWKCGTCNTFSCSTCRQPKKSRDDPDHVCKQEDIDTVKLLTDGTKPCPTCATLISHISGCSQMWCPGCNCTFDWNTGRTVTGVIHNPEYFAWMRRNGGVLPRQEGDRPGMACLPMYEHVLRTMEQRRDFSYNLESCYQAIAHVTNVTMNEFPGDANAMDNTDLRIRYLNGMITEEKMKTKLQARIKKREKNRAVFQVLELFTTALTDLFSTYVDGTLATQTSLKDQAHEIRNFVNEALRKVSRRYNNVTPQFTYGWYQADTNTIR